MLPTPSAHRLRLGLPGYLILFAPLAFAPERRYQPRWAPSPLVFLPISMHSTATPGIPPSSAVPKPNSMECSSLVEQSISQSTDLAACAPFTPSNSEQRLLPPYYRGCWHGVSRSFLWRYRQTGDLFAHQQFFPPDRALRSYNLHRPRGVARSGFPPLPKPLDCCLP